MLKAFSLKCLGFRTLLLLTGFVGWFFYGGAEVPSQNVTTNSHSVTNVALDPVATPISSDLTKNQMMSLQADTDDVIRHIVSQYQRTSGLHPGRGDPIPRASDVHELPVVDISFYNWRGELLSGWIALTAPQAPVIILTHGTPGNRVSMIERAAFLYKHGFNVLLFDFQSYGRSQGIMSTLGMVESEDILAAISYLRGLPDTMYSKIGVVGLSMGATAAVLAASRSRDIVALVAESCPVDATRVPGDVSGDEERDADQQLVQQVYGVDITQARPINSVGKLAGRTAIFFINGDADTITPLSGMETLYQSAGDPKQSWVVAGADHAQAFSLDPTEYSLRVNTFFDTYLR